MTCASCGAILRKGNKSRVCSPCKFTAAMEKYDRQEENHRNKNKITAALWNKKNRERKNEINRQYRLRLKREQKRDKE